MIQNHGINDMSRGWRSENEWNKKVYQKWNSMLVRCYSEKYHKKQPTYIGCSVCSKWLKLSGFVEDFKLIDGYDEEKFLNGELCLDKDIKSNGTNKIYSLNNCMLVSKAENNRQSNKTMDYSFMKERIGENHPCFGRTGENHPMYGKTGENNPCSIKIVQYDKKNNFIKIWNGANEVQRELEINQSHIIACCKWYNCGEDLEKWFKRHREAPRKTAGGFIWKYYKEGDINER